MPQPIPNICRLALLICFSAVMCLLAWHRPFWGLIDDGNILRMVDQIRANGLWAASKHFAWADLKWGMFRPYMPAMMLALYGWSSTNAFYTYFLNILWVVAGHWLLYFSFFRSTAGKDLRLFLAAGEPVSATNGAALALLLSFACVWFQYYFLLPSLQEKVVVIWAASALFILSSRMAQERGLAAFAFLLAIIVVTGALTKAQFVFFWPIFFALASYSRYPKRKLVILTIAFAIGAVSLKLLASRGVYTEGYSISAVLVTLRESKSVYLFTAIAIAHAAGALYARKRSVQRAQTLLTFASPALGLLIFVTLMLPWRVGGYLNVITIPFLSLIFAIWVLWLARYPSSQRFLVYALAGAAVGISTIKNHLNYQAYGSLRYLVDQAKAGEWPAEAVRVQNSCNEGSGHLAYYLQRFGGVSDLVVQFTDPIQYEKLAMKSGVYFWIEHPKICPPPQGVAEIDLASRAVVLGEAHGNAFQLVRYTPKVKTSN